MQLPSIPAPIEDYALLSDRHGAALVSRAGSIDWLCWPRFDSAACFAALLGGPDNGRWQICPCEEPVAIRRHYREGSMVLETEFETASGVVAVIDFMPTRGNRSVIFRIVEGRRGEMAMCMRLKIRFEYGAVVPWVSRLEPPAEGIVAIAGPDLAVLYADVETRGEEMETVADFVVAAERYVRFQLIHGPSHLQPPRPLDPYRALAETDGWWREWSGRNQADGTHAAAVRRSLLVLKALSYAPTGGIVAAPTTSLPESLGGKRNWDYRFCWLRDATMTLHALMDAGYYEEAQAWGHWLHRSIAGAASQVQIMYGIAGERRMDEWTVPWLEGYEKSAPVRIGNQAAGQVQLDIYGEVMASMRELRLNGLTLPAAAWAMQVNLLEHLEGIWRDPDEGIWEVRGGARQFTFSKIMAWLAFHCAVRDCEQFGLEGPAARWRGIRDEIHALVCAQGFDAKRDAFVQSFDESRLDASLLLIPVLGFLPVDDARVTGTVRAIETELLRDGLVMRYEVADSVDGLTGPEGAFLACSFWLVNCMVLAGRREEAEALFTRLVGLANDVGLLAEEYDTQARRQVGNFPQALSHMALVASAAILRDGAMPSYGGRA